MRTFILRNSAGREYDLMNPEHFFHSPDGLGFSYNSKYEQVGTQYEELMELLEQPKPSGTMKFNSYAEYTEFVKFIQRKPLILIYKPENEEFRLDCKVAKLKKSEKESGGWIQCPIAFEGIGTWYKYTVLQTDPNAVGKTYDYTYPYVYTNSASNTLVIGMETNVKSPTILTFIGPCTNPSWKHYVNGIEVASGKIDVHLAEGERMRVSSVMPYAIQKLDDQGQEIEDLYGASDFSTQRFLWLEIGENSITVSHEGTDDLNVIIEAYEYYESV